MVWGWWAGGWILPALFERAKAERGECSTTLSLPPGSMIRVRLKSNSLRMGKPVTEAVDTKPRTTVAPAGPAVLRTVTECVSPSAAAPQANANVL